MASAEIVKHLIEIDGRPWAELKGGKPITQNSLARMLGNLRIISGTIRLPNGQFPKGYYRSAFDDAFERYLSPQTATPPQLNNDGHCGGLQSATPIRMVGFQKRHNTIVTGIVAVWRRGRAGAAPISTGTPSAGRIN